MNEAQFKRECRLLQLIRMALSKGRSRESIIRSLVIHENISLEMATQLFREAEVQ
jgi:hypothetical protein